MRRPITLALCSYSSGVGNGIAHMDQTLVDALDSSRFRIRRYVLRPDLPAGTQIDMPDGLHCSLADAYESIGDPVAATRARDRALRLEAKQDAERGIREVDPPGPG